MDILAIVLGIGTLILRLKFNRWMSRIRMREQLLVLGAWLVFCGCVFGARYLWYQWYTEPAPSPYATVEEAVEDGCVVLSAPGIPEGGEERWDEFYGRVEFGIPDYVKIAIWDGGVCLNVNELLYDGKEFHYTFHSSFKNRRSETVTYPYLLLLRYEPPTEENELYLWRESYVLTNKPDLTGEEVAKMLYLSQQGVEVHTLIYETEWKPENKVFDGWP